MPAPPRSAGKAPSTAGTSAGALSDVRIGPADALPDGERTPAAGCPSLSQSRRRRITMRKTCLAIATFTSLGLWGATAIADEPGEESNAAPPEAAAPEGGS